MFGIVNSLIKPKTESLPYFVSTEECCNKFADCFILKIKTLIDQREYANITITESVLCKETIIRPVLKKYSIEVDILSSYRPVSNLTQVSKCLKKVIAQQLIEHTSEMTELYHSAYISNHSTETALIAVCHDIKRGFDNRKGTALIMIDLSL